MIENPTIHFIESDAIPPEDEDDDEIWWTDHYLCDCGWESPSWDNLPDGGRNLAEQHYTETGHKFDTAA